MTTNPRFIVFAGRMVRTEHIVNAVVSGDIPPGGVPGVVIEVHEPDAAPLYLTEVAIPVMDRNDPQADAKRMFAAHELLDRVCAQCNGDPERERLALMPYPASESHAVDNGGPNEQPKPQSVAELFKKPEPDPKAQITFTRQQVTNVCPDDQSLAAAIDLEGDTDRWLFEERDGNTINAECVPSNPLSKAYTVRVDVSESNWPSGPIFSFQCGCQSQKNPCKHALALLYRHAEE